MILLTSGSTTLDPRDRRRVILVNGILLIGIVALSLAGTSAYVTRGNLSLAVADFIVAAIAAALIVWLRLTLHIRAVGSSLLVIIGALFTFLLITGGDRNTGPLWTYLFPLFAFFLLGTKLGWLLTMTLFAVMATLLFQPDWLKTVYDPAFRGRFLGSLLTLTGVAYLYEASRKEAESRMQVALKETDDIFQAIREGLFLIQKVQDRFIVGSKSSVITQAFFGSRALAGSDFVSQVQTLNARLDISGVEKYLNLLFNVDFEESMLEQINPLRQIESFDSKEKRLRFLSFGFYRVVTTSGNERKVSSLMCTVIDETDALTFQKKLAEQEQHEASQTQLLLLILNIEPFLMKNFLQKAAEYIQEINDLFRGTDQVEQHLLDSVYRKVHSIKGDAGALGLKQISEVAHSAEKRIEEIKSMAKPGGSDLFAFLTDLSQVKQKCDDIAELQKRLSKHYHQNFETMVNPVKVILNKLLSTLSAETGKTARMRLNLEELNRIPKKLHGLIQEILVQLLRNSFAHGLENVAERKRLRKSENGNIYVKSEILNNLFRITYQDDGSGLNLDRIRQKAVSLGLGTQSEIETWPDKKIRSLIFHKGFSTAETITMSAGRGVGMDIIYEHVRSVGGTIKLRTQWLKGIEFVIEFDLEKLAREQENHEVIDS